MKKKNLTKAEIIKRLSENKTDLSRYGIKSIGLFGSFAREEESGESDIDLVLDFEKSHFGKDFRGLFDAYLQVSSYLENLLGRKVDILTPVSIETIRIKTVAEGIKKSIVYV
jgi:hypothetical protein